MRPRIVTSPYPAARDYVLRSKTGWNDIELSNIASRYIPLMSEKTRMAYAVAVVCSARALKQVQGRRARKG
jgi:hypothetical protein